MMRCASTGNGNTCSRFALLRALKTRIRKVSGVEDFTFHCARHTLRTALDRLGCPPHIKDECLNHARQGVGARHYSHYTYEAEQRQAFEAWLRGMWKHSCTARTWSPSQST